MGEKKRKIGRSVWMTAEQAKDIDRAVAHAQLTADGHLSFSTMAMRAILKWVRRLPP